MAIRKRTFYTLLGVPTNADAKMLAAAYQKVIARLQPRSDAGDETARDEIDLANEAYKTLMDPMRRERYDDKIEAEHAIAHGAPASGSSAWIYIVIGALVIALAAGYYVNRRAKAAQAAAVAAEEARIADEDAKAKAAAEFLRKQEQKLDDAALERRQREERAEIQRLQTDSRRTGIVQQRAESSLEMQKRWEDQRLDMQKRKDEFQAKQEERNLQQRQQQELNRANAKLKQLENNR